MLGVSENVDSVARVIQVALTPVFLLSGIGALLGVFATRLARVADRVDALSEKLGGSTREQRPQIERRLAYLRRRSHALDAAVILGAFGGGATALAALLLFVGTLRDQTTVGFLFASFGLALLCTIGALTAFLVEMLMASRGIRDQAGTAEDGPEACHSTEPDQNGLEASSSTPDRLRRTRAEV